MKDFISKNKSLIGAVLAAILIYFFGGTVKDYFTSEKVEVPTIDSLPKDNQLLDTLNK